jgi:transcriptional regulator with XRE-family HTH domain
MYEDVRTRRDIRKLLGARVKKVREERGLGRLELGRRSGLSEMEVGLIENGSKPIRCEDLVCLAKGLGVSPVTFFEGW